MSDTPTPEPILITRNAECEHCGYHLSGTPIVDRSARCPECGKLTHFQLRGSDNKTPPRDRGLGFAVMVGLFLIAVGVPIAFLVPTWALGIIALAIGVAALAVAPRLVRRWFGL
ncbi:MAG: hypothetical protein DYG94_03895 [Leptolyngbya sp. PLA3]|nr:MAG: hypothetical protein EDM82_08650 [Cyanobacteria bacterium CYA]MCE7967872.1 hypothetical protein [Leptolyngbya sp. PL-A3]